MIGIRFCNLGIIFAVCLCMTACSKHSATMVHEHEHMGEFEEMAMDGVVMEDVSFSVEDQAPLDDSQFDHSDMMAFQDTAAKDRMMNLVNHWLALVSDPNKPIESFHDVLAADFDLNLPDKRIKNFGQFVRWYEAHQVTGSNQVSNFSFQEVADDQYTLEFDVDSAHHSWTVVDNPKRPFANIKRMDVTESATSDSQM